MVRAQRRRRARGLTLIEVMVALLVTTIALLGALATVGITVRGANFSRNATEASILAQSKLESKVSLLSGTTGSLPTPALETENNLDGNGAAQTNGTGIYTRTTQWTASPDGLRRVCTVTVSWPDLVDPTKSHQVIASRQQDLQ